MKIGILTLPLHTNYGGILQAYALQTVLERMGHEVEVFDTPNRCFLPPIWKLPLSYIKRIVLKCLGKTDRIFIEQYTNKIQPIILQNIQPFIAKNIHRKEIRKFSMLQAGDYNAIVVGSDQVFRKAYFLGWNRQSIENAYLSFTQGWGVKRIAYAASFGTDEWEYSNAETKRCKALLRKFDAVSVREESGVELCLKYFSMDVLHVLDPTMLLNKEDYSVFFQKADIPKSEGTLLTYILDETEELQELITKVANQKHLAPFSVNNPYEYDNSKPLEERIKPSVETWLRGFYDAEFVVTDSFHACVFSIIFRKQFVVVGNKDRGMPRFESLLKTFGLQDRLVDSSTNVANLRDVNYDVVYEKYDVLKKQSISFLNKHLR